jgi:hypothetical protein
MIRDGRIKAGLSKPEEMDGQHPCRVGSHWTTRNNKKVPSRWKVPPKETIVILVLPIW